MKRFYLTLMLVFTMALAGCGATNGSAGAPTTPPTAPPTTQPQTTPIALAEYSSGRLSFKLNSAFTVEGDGVYRDEAESITYLPALVGEAEFESPMVLLASLMGEIRMDSSFQDFYFYSTTANVEALELQAENGDTYQYDIMVVNYADRSVAVLAAEVGGEFVTCTAGYNDQKQTDTAIAALETIAKTVQIAQEEAPLALVASNDIVSNTSWTATDDGSYMVFADDTDYAWYQSKDDKNDNYFAGTYQFYMGEAALQHITVDLADFGVTNDEMQNIFDNSDTYDLEHFVCMTVANDSFMLSGVEQLGEIAEVHYYGFLLLDGTYLDIANMTTGAYYGFTKEA